MINLADIIEYGSDLQSLFNAHTPQEGYLTKMCKHYYCNVLSIAELIKSPDNKITAFGHVHDEYEFLIPLDPTPMIVQNDAVYFGEVGFIYPIMGGRPHAIQIEYNNIANYNITVQKDFMERRLAEKGLAMSEFNARFAMSPELDTLIHLFITEFDKGAATDKIDLNLLGFLIVSAIIETGCRPSLADRRKPQQQYQKGMKSVVEYVNQHFTENITVEGLAELSGFTKNYFIASFKKMMGEPPYEHIKKLRISKAKVLLANSNLSVSEIASQCGFVRTSSFTSLFKSETGTTPTEYRNQDK